LASPIKAKQNLVKLIAFFRAKTAKKKCTVAIMIKLKEKLTILETAKQWKIISVN
jgi:hypothetical protein